MAILFCGRQQCERCSAGQPRRCPHMTCGTPIHKSKSTNNAYLGGSTYEVNSALALVLSISLIATGCSAQWVSVALADLPVLTQMALNIAALVATLQSGRQLNPAEALAIPNFSSEASKDLTLLQALDNAYRANPSADALQKIESMFQQTNQGVPALPRAADISDPALSARMTAAVNLILASVSSFAALIPQPPSTAPTTARRNTVISQPKDLKRQNQQVCAPSGNAVLDVALSQRVLR
jgi:hypothetical protein